MIDSGQFPVDDIRIPCPAHCFEHVAGADDRDGAVVGAVDQEGGDMPGDWAPATCPPLRT